MKAIHYGLDKFLGQFTQEKRKRVHNHQTYVSQDWNSIKGAEHIFKNILADKRTRRFMAMVFILQDITSSIF